MTSHYKNRIKQHKHDQKNGSKLPVHCAMRRHNYRFQRVIYVPLAIMPLVERVCIWLFGTYKRGYNLTMGGEGLLGAVVTESSREQRAIKFTNPFHGFKLPDLEYIGSWTSKAQCSRDLGFPYKFISMVLSGEYKKTHGYWFTEMDIDYVRLHRDEILKTMEPSKTKNMPENHRKWSSERMKALKYNLGKKLTTKEREALARKRDGRTLGMFTMDDKLVKTFASQSLAADYVGVGPSTIGSCISGRNKTSAGYKWRYIN